MSRVILDIIALSGGLQKLRRVEVQPAEKPMLTIERQGDGITVTLGTVLTADFTIITTRRDRAKIECPAWSKPLDTMLRKNGYVEAAMHFHLSSHD